MWRRTCISKTTILSWLRGYFVGTSIFVRTSVPSRNTSSSEDISRARCTKRYKGQRWIWKRTSGKKWQQFLPTCCNEWCRTSRNAWGNVLTTRTPPHRHYIQEVNVVIKMLWDKDKFLVINLRKKTVCFSFYFNLKIVRFFSRTLYKAGGAILRYYSDEFRVQMWKRTSALNFPLLLLSQ